MDIKITRADAAALWHAVEAMKWQMRSMRELLAEKPGRFTPAEIAVEEARLAAAKASLRKVQAQARAARRAD